MDPRQGLRRRRQHGTVGPGATIAHYNRFDIFFNEPAGVRFRQDPLIHSGKTGLGNMTKDFLPADLLLAGETAPTVKDSETRAAVGGALDEV